MKPENILKSDVLDIIFENKNKAYGAYELRKTYPQRITKSLAIMISCVLVFVAFQSWKTPKKTTTLHFGPVIELTKLDNYKKPKELVKPKPKTVIQQKMAAVIITTPKVVEDILATKIPDNKAIDTSFISNSKSSEGPASIDLVGVVAGTPHNKPIEGDGEIGDKKGGNNTVVEDETPMYNPSQQPEYPGGLEALKNFMLRHLRQPDDMNEGEKIIVIAKFVVDKTGAIEQIEIVQNGREDLDQEVVRVIKKMPHWKPGNQAGKTVDVYYKMPITFTNQ